MIKIMLLLKIFLVKIKHSKQFKFLQTAERKSRNNLELKAQIKVEVLKDKQHMNHLNHILSINPVITQVHV